MTAVPVSPSSAPAPGAVSAPASAPAGNVYDKAGTRHPVERRLVDGFEAALASLLPSRAQRVLDVGCGEGIHMRSLASVLPDAVVTGVDIADAGWLADRHPPARDGAVIAGDAVELPFASRSFDLVLALEVLEHLTDPRAALGEIARVCRDLAVLSVPWEPLWRMGNLARGRYVGSLGNTPGHLQHFSRRGFVRLVGRYFDVEVVRRPFPWTLTRVRTRTR